MGKKNSVAFYANVQWDQKAVKSGTVEMSPVGEGLSCTLEDGI